MRSTIRSGRHEATERFDWAQDILRGVQPVSADHQSARVQPHVALEMLADRVDVVELPGVQRQHRGITDTPLSKRTQFGTFERAGGVFGRATDHLGPVSYTH